MSLDDIIRKSYRLPLEGSDVVKAEINQNKYPIVDLGNKGIGIRLFEPDEFSVGDNLDSITLTLDKKKFSLQGVVVHISPDISDHYLCGVEFTNLDEEGEKNYRKFIQKHRSDLFSNK